MSDPKAFDKTVAVPSPSDSSAESVPLTAAKLSDPLGPVRLGGRYELLSLLGVGGMGAVYRARDLELDEIVALKMLRRELLDDAQSLARFRQEVKLARKVTHKNVARTFDIGEHGGHKFLTMEFIDGSSLAALLTSEGRMPLTRAVDVVEAICAGLSAAHAVGVVHRDLKPDNVLIAKDDRVVITDFGIARAASEEAGAAVRTMGHPIGTPAYMAPEQVEGSANVDARTDIYALGAMLYELVTGERAWDGESVYAVAVKRLTKPPPNPREKRTELPDAAARLIMRCMARKPDDRYSTIAEVASELAALTLPAPRAQTSPPPRRPEHAPRDGAEPKVVAVLPFRNAGAAEDEYLVDGLTDDLIDTLSMTPGLRVRARGVVMGLKGKTADPRELGRELGVQVVVEGTVRRAGDRLRVNARVVSVADGFQLWAQRFDRSAAEVFAVGDETARAVAQALTLDATMPQREAPTDPVAVDLYLRARHEYLKYWRAHVLAAKDLFEQALARAPDDPMILSGYAMTLTRIFMFDPQADAAGERAREVAERALRLAPHLGEPRVALATYKLNIGDSVGAAEEVRRALAVSPTLSEAQDLYGRLLVEVGELDAGIARLRLALAGEPRLAICSYEIGRAYALLGQLDQSDAMFGAPPSEHGSTQLYWIHRARIALWHQRVDLARQWLADMRARDAVPYAAGALLQVVIGEAVSDDERRDVEERASAPGRALRRRAFFGQIASEVRAVQRNVDEALRWLETADAAGLFDLAWLERCPILGALRADPRYARVHAATVERAARVRDALGATATPVKVVP